MQVSNVRYYPNIDWDDYLKLPGKSFSGLKSDGAQIVPTHGMHIGKLVHTYLLKPKEYNYEEQDIVIPIARKLVNIHNGIISFSEIELGMTCNLVVDGLCMQYKGLGDTVIRNELVIDYKILAGDLQFYLDRFKYKDQVRGYMLPAKAPVGLIIAYNKKTKQVQFESFGQDVRWWEYKVKQYGIPCEPQY